MAEPIGVASGVLALVVFAYDTSKSLYEEVASFKSRRKTIKDVESDLGSLVTLLESIRHQAENPRERLLPLDKPLKCCADTCQEMQKMLSQCTKHSNAGHDSVRDWVNMRYHEKSFEDMKQRLSSYKSTLNIAFQSINIQDHSKTQDSLDDLKASINDIKGDLEEQLDEVKQALSSADAPIRDIIQADQALLESGIESLDRAQQVVNTTTPQITVTGNIAGENARAIFGTDTSQPQFNLNVSDNQAKAGAVVGAGVHSPETLRALLSQSQTPNLALALQELQKQSKGSISLQSLLENIPASTDESS